MKTSTTTSSLKLTVRRFIVSYLIPLPFLIGELVSHLGGDGAMAWWVILVVLPYMVVWCATMIRAHFHWHYGWKEIAICGVLPAVVLGPITIIVITVVKVILVG